MSSDQDHPNDDRSLPSVDDPGIAPGSVVDVESPSSDSRFRLPLWAKGALLVAVLVLASLGYLQSSFWQKPTFSKTGLAELDPAELAKRKPIKEFDLTDIDGKRASLADYKGNVVILSFWASWCTPCLVELPTFAELQKKYYDQGLRVVPVNIDEGNDGKQFARDFWRAKNFPFPSYFDTSKVLSQQFEVEMLPSNFVIDREGRLVFSSFGANDWSNPGTMEFIEGLLQESPDDSAQSADQNTDSSQSTGDQQ